MTVGERIKNRRQELGFSVDEVAKRLGKNRATIYRYESGDIEDLPTTVLESIASVLDITPAELMGWEPDPQPGYYLGPETARLAQEMFEDPDMRSLFSMKRNMDPKQFRNYIDFMKAQYRLEHPED